MSPPVSLLFHSLTRYFAGATGSELMPGVVAAIQTFGDRINFHPHLHFLVTEGAVDETGISPVGGISDCP